MTVTQSPFRATVPEEPSTLQRLRVLAETMTDREVLLDLFFELSNDLFVVADKQGYFHHVNHRWTELLGWSKDELLADKFYAFIHPDDVARTRAAVETMNGKPIGRFVNRYKRKSGGYRTLEWTSSRMHDGKTYAVARDITEMCAACPVQRDCPHLKESPSCPQPVDLTGTREDGTSTGGSS